MDRFVIQGGKELSGRTTVQGAKNAVLPILVATLLVDTGKTVVHRVPDLMDISTIIRVLEHLGAKVNRDRGRKTVTINAENLVRYDAPYELVRKMRASFLVLGPLLARMRRARVSLPGGCSIGPRPVNFHLEGFKRLGVEVTEEHGYVQAVTGGLRGTVVYFDRPSHTGTENLVMGACLAEGKTIIVNAACDPEVEDLANFLNAMGGQISGAGTSVIEIQGVKRLKAGEYSPIGDRLEAATLLMAGAITGGQVEVEGVNPRHLMTVILKLREMGIDIEEKENGLRARGPKRCRAVQAITYPYPGFPTDLQASLMALTTVAEGTSCIRETVFQDRFSHVMELNRLGARISVSGDEATIQGVSSLKGASLMCSDIRAGAGLVLAGLVAEGETELLRVYHIDRGYEGLERKLTRLGATIARVAES